MNKLKLIQTGFDDLFIIETFKIGDTRGYFSETYNYRDLKSIGIDIHFVQDNQSRSMHGVMRGLHFQNSPLLCCSSSPDIYFLSAGPLSLPNFGAFELPTT